MRRFVFMALAGVLALPLFTGKAQAQADVLDQSKVGAALAALYVTDMTTMTYTSVIITNTSNDEIILSAEVIDGDANENWIGQSFRCPMTPGETTQFVFRPAAGGRADLAYECSIPGAGEFSDPADLSQPKNQNGLFGSKGIFWVSIENAAGATLSLNVLEGKSLVLGYMEGTAYEVGAMPFQAPDPMAQDFDTTYKFNGLEYARFPESLTASFHAVEPGLTEATLILFTLDGTLSSPTTPNAAVTIHLFNDDEEFSNLQGYFFDCFVMVKLDDIDSRFLRANLGSQVGHVRLIPRSVDPNDENHDNGAIGTDDNRRYVGVLGWLIQTIRSTADLNDAQGNPIKGAPGFANDARWSSALTTSMTPLPNHSGDTPALVK